MSLIIPANTLASGGFAVANSCRFNIASSDNLSRTPSSGSNRKTFTISMWVKGTTTTTQTLMSAGETSGAYTFNVQWDSSKLSIIGNADSSSIMNLKTTRLFRDFSAWYHFVLAFDTTQGTDTNRVKVYVNGVQETSFSTSTYPSQNTNIQINNNTPHSFGKSAVNNQFWGGYMAELILIDGSALAPTDFGEFDEDSGIWKPINVSGLTFGTNGFYLDFEASGNLGNDANGGTDLTEVNLAATDQATDTCTNNFCTMNPLIPTTNATFSQGNCKLTIGGSSIQGAGIGTFGLTAGKWYFEVKLLADKDNHTHGAISELTAELNANVTAIQNDVGVTSWINGDGGEVVVDGTATTADYGIMAENSIMGIALDIDNYNITYLDDNSALVSNFNMSSTRGTIFPLIKMGINCAAEVNFGGCSAFAVSSANSDADGHGNFEHAPPSGYFAICSKNLAEYG